MLDKDGVARVTTKYDDRGNQVEEAVLRHRWKARARQRGRCPVDHKYDNRGNQVEEAYFGIDGKPVLNTSGVARMTVKYDGGNQVETAYFGTDGKPVLDTIRLRPVDRKIRHQGE